MNGKHEEALKIAESILMEDPSCVEAAEEVSDNLLSLERIKEASRGCSICVISFSQKLYCQFCPWLCCFPKRRSMGKSIAFFQMSNAGQPNNPEILRCLGWSLFPLENEMKELQLFEERSFSETMIRLFCAILLRVIFR